MNKLIVSYAPHIRTDRTTKSLMLDVIIALMPALLAGVWWFGLPALLMVMTCVVSCVVFEYAWTKIFKMETTIGDLSAVITGIYGLEWLVRYLQLSSLKCVSEDWGITL